MNFDFDYFDFDKREHFGYFDFDKRGHFDYLEGNELAECGRVVERVH